MCREILFKAKRADNGKWVEGDLRQDIDLETAYISGWDYYIDDEGYEREPYEYEIDTNTICQYTGLTDKNGKKIWEGDILQGHGNKKDLSKVAFGKIDVIEVESLEKIETVIGWYYKPLETDALSKCEPFCLPMPLTDEYINRCEFEVIGNIFDNPELLTTNEGA